MMTLLPIRAPGPTTDPAKTTVAPYSLRAKASPTVSTPLTWDEVAAGGLISFTAPERPGFPPGSGQSGRRGIGWCASPVQTDAVRADGAWQVTWTGQGLSHWHDNLLQPVQCVLQAPTAGP